MVLYVQIHGKYKDKTKQKPPEVEKAPEGNGQLGQQPATTAVGTTTVRPWLPPRAVVVTGCGGSVSFRAPRFGLLVLRLGPQVFAFLGVFWASFCYHLVILMALTSLVWIHLKHFSQNLGLNHRNLQ